MTVKSNWSRWVAESEGGGEDAGRELALDPRSSLLNSVLGPSSRICGEEDRTRARLLAVIMLAQCAAIVLGTAAATLFWQRTLGHSILWGPHGLVLLSCTILVLMSWTVLRLGALRLGTFINLCACTAYPLIAPFVGHPRHEIALLSTGMIPILIALIVMSPRQVLAYVLAFGGIVALELLGLPLASSESTAGFAILLSLLASSLLLLAFHKHLHRLESLRTGRLQESEVALRAGEERLRTLVEHSRDLIIVIDREDNRRETYGDVQGMLGFRPDELGSRSYLDHIHPEDLERMKPEMERLKRTPGYVVRTEWRHQQKDGSYRWLEGTFSNRFGVPGIDGIALGVRDIDERHGLDEIVRHSEERYRSLFATVTDAILISNRDEKLIEVNDTATQQLGYTREELLSMHLIDLVPPEHVLNFKRVQDRLAREGHLIAEAAQRHKNGSVIPVELAVTLVDRGGGPMFVAISRDISERRKTEEEHRRMEEQLHHASKMESIGRLAGGVAHDFNNLLTAILGNLEMIAHKQRQSESIQEPLAEIREAALSASTLTRQLLAFSRKQVVEPHRVDPNELLDRMQRMLQRMIGEDIKLRTVKGDGLGTIRVDPSLIEQTIVNMVVNARDAMPGGGLLAIETANVTLDLAYQHDHPLVAPGRYVMFAISDTGTGMNEEVQSHLFEPFFTTKPRGQGTGLGLATSYGAVRQSNGHITVYSEPGKGTTFKIFLPVVNEKPERLVTPSPDDPSALAGGGETVLVVEDDEHVRSLVARSLKTCGYKILVASHGEEALSLARATQDKIHLLLTDVVMPGINGRQLSERLATIHPETRTLFTSGYTENVILHHGILDKGIHFLSKPYSLDDMARRVRSVLDA
jgi:two-component system, cell cycle sensor histidine kinase and response regulator CckA